MSTSSKNLEIEALRGIAIVVTLAAHFRLLFYWAPDWFERFASMTSLGTGVDLFFCISGFVIARSVIPKLPVARNWHAFKTFAYPFWVRRMWRLWPSALLWLAIYLLLTAVFNSTGAFGPLKDTVRSTVAAALQLANIYFPFCVEQHNCGSNLVYWSLSLEEQFYLLFPIVLFAFRRSTLAFLFSVLIAAQILIPRASASLLWSIRTEAIAFGVLIALLSLKRFYWAIEPTPLNRWALRTISFVALVYLLVRAPTLWPTLSPGVAAPVSAALVWIAGYNRGYLLTAGPLRSFLSYIGSRSYAIYLCHEAVFLGTREIWHRMMPHTQFDGTFTIRFALTATVLTFALAEATYWFLETPMRRRGQRISKEIRERFSRRQERATANQPA